MGVDGFVSYHGSCQTPCSYGGETTPFGPCDISCRYKNRRVYTERYRSIPQNTIHTYLKAKNGAKRNLPAAVKVVDVRHQRQRRRQPGIRTDAASIHSPE